MVRAPVTTSMPSRSTPRRRISPACGVELRVHRDARRGTSVDVADVVLQAARGLQAEQAAADHHGAFVLAGVPHHGAGVVERAEREDALVEAAAGPADPGDRRDERRGCRWR